MPQCIRALPLHSIHLDGVDIEIQRFDGAPSPASARPTLVFLHEGLGSIALWKDWPMQLCQSLGLNGLVYSRHGYGASSPRQDVRGPTRHEDGQWKGRLPADYMHQEAKRTLHELLNALQIKNPILIGHSDGATIALLYAAQYPTTAVAVMAPHVMVEAQTLEAIAEARKAYETGDLRTRLSPYHSDIDGAFWQWNDVWLSEAFRNFDIRAACSRIACPLLLIQGLDDPYGSLLQVQEIADRVPQSQLVALPGCGHVPHVQQREKTEVALQKFLMEVVDPETQ